MDFGGKECKLHCPKCRGRNLRLAEVWDGNGIYFEVEDGLMPDEATDHFAGGPVFVEGKCRSCDHIWRVRGGVKSIYDLIVEE